MLDQIRSELDAALELARAYNERDKELLNMRKPMRLDQPVLVADPNDPTTWSVV